MSDVLAKLAEAWSRREDSEARLCAIELERSLSDLVVMTRDEFEAALDDACCQVEDDHLVQDCAVESAITIEERAVLTSLVQLIDHVRMRGR